MRNFEAIMDVFRSMVVYGKRLLSISMGLAPGTSGATKPKMRVLSSGEWLALSS